MDEYGENWSANMKKEVVTASVERLLQGFVKVDMPPDVICSIGMSIVGSIIVSSPDDSEFRASSIKSLSDLVFKMRNIKEGDIDPEGTFL